MNKNELIPHLFRNEYAKIVAVLCKRYGLSHIELAEDFVSDSFLKATETWKLKGIPDNPTAWLYTVAKNNANDFFKRKDTFENKVKHELTDSLTFQELDLDFSEQNISDSQLQMLFAICHPLISSESQIALALRTLCGFGVEEIANALLSTKQTINKRLFRAKEKLRKHNVDLSFPEKEELTPRLDNILLILYLLFNEGYFTTKTELPIRKDLCSEAIRLLFILIQNPQTNVTKANALMALFCFHASRLEARTDEAGKQILLNDQDKTQWNQALIEKGETYLNHSASGNNVSKYHLEAIIAFWHTRINIDEKIKWENILQAYNRLLQLEYSPIAALNRTYALSKTQGKKSALNEALKIDLATHSVYHLLLAELYNGLDSVKEENHLQKALSISKNEHEKELIREKIQAIKS